MSRMGMRVLRKRREKAGETGKQKEKKKVHK